MLLKTSPHPLPLCFFAAISSRVSGVDVEPLCACAAISSRVSGVDVEPLCAWNSAEATFWFPVESLSNAPVVVEAGFCA
ncbi:MAG: hypothetical protein DME05_18765 [Candidatus Rokuibacteriota bacterium]|nr:MAG: hypothetical protein DME05_18765 [Candidatus Rokubacteria bacterium]